MAAPDIALRGPSDADVILSAGTAPGLWVNVSGASKRATGIWVNAAGTAKELTVLAVNTAAGRKDMVFE